MKRLMLYFSVFLQVFVLSSLPALASPADLIIGGLNQAAAEPGYSTSLNVPTLVGRMIGVLLSAIGIAFVIILIYAGILYLTASGEPAKVEKAKKMITQAIIGIILMIGAYAITSYVVTQLQTATK